MKRWIVPVAGGGVVAVLLGVGVLAAVRSGPSPATAQAPTVAPPTASASAGVTRTVAVDGVGVVSGIPDTLTVNLGVSVLESSAAEALASANTKAKALIDTLISAGVAKADIQTGYLSVWPMYPGSEQTRPSQYTASNSVTATLHDIDRAGAVIDAAAEAVGDGITMYGTSFSIADTSGLYTQARQQAVTEATRRGGELASAAGVSLGPVVSMNESAQEIPHPAAYDRSATTAAAGAAAMPIEPGKQEIQLRVQVVFELVG
jgi:uncharacterized protein